MNKCDACGLQGQNVELIYVRTTNGGITLCRQCLDEINRKNPETKSVKEQA